MQTKKRKKEKKNNDNCANHSGGGERSSDNNEQCTQHNNDNKVLSSDGSRAMRVAFEFRHEVSRVVDDDTRSQKKEEDKCEMGTYISFANITLNETYGNNYS